MKLCGVIHGPGIFTYETDSIEKNDHIILRYSKGDEWTYLISK